MKPQDSEQCSEDYSEQRNRIVANLKWGVILSIGAFLISIFLGIFSGVGILHIIIRAFIFAVVFFGIGFGMRFLVDSFFPELLFSDRESTDTDSLDESGMKVNIVLDNKGEYAVPELYKTDDPHEIGNIDDLISGVFKPRSAGEQRPAASASAGFGMEGIDRTPETGYNTGSIQETAAEPAVGFSPAKVGVDNLQDLSVFEKTPASRPVFTPSFGDDMGLGGLPDLDMMAMAFSSGYTPAPASSMPSAAPAASPAAASFIPTSAAFPASAPFSDSGDSPPEERRSGYTGNKPEPLKGDFDPKDLAMGISTMLGKDK
jgi:hypothetical protein